MINTQQTYLQWWKMESISPKVRNKTRVPTLTTTIQHSFGSFSHSNQRRKRNKRIQIGKEEGKPSLFADDMILYIENPKESTRKLIELWCWRRLLRVPWTTIRSNQSILKEISLGCSLEWLMLKLKLQYFCHLMWRVDSFEKTLMLGRLRAGG